MRKAQRFFSRLVAGTLFRKQLNSASVLDMVRLRSCLEVGAGTFLVCAPSESEVTELPDAVFRHAVWWRLGLPVCASSLRCYRGYFSNSSFWCGCALDRAGDHLVYRNVGGHNILLHPRVVAALRGILCDSGALVPEYEVYVAGWGSSSGEAARLEIQFTVAGTRHYMDIVIKHPRAWRVLESVAEVDGAAAEKGEQSKLRRCPAVPHLGLDAVVPFGVEFFGRLGKSALRLLRSARARVVESDGRFDG